MWLKCAALQPSPSVAFFISTKSPTRQFLPTAAPARRQAYGPTVLPSPTRAPCRLLARTTAPRPTKLSDMWQNGSTAHPSHSTLFPVTTHGPNSLAPRHTVTLFSTNTSPHTSAPSLFSARRE